MLNNSYPIVFLIFHPLICHSLLCSCVLCTSLTRFKSVSCLGACPAPACCPKPLSPLITCCPAVCQAVALPDAVPPRSPGPCLRGVYNVPGVVKCRLHDTRRNAEAATADTGMFQHLRTCHLSCLALPCPAIILEGRKDGGKGEASTHVGFGETELTGE